MTLSILCVTRGEPHAEKFLREMRAAADELDAALVVGLDRVQDFPPDIADALVYLTSDGYLESVLEQAVRVCEGDYILRLDDDERCTPGMITWLKTAQYESATVWAFPRANLWGDEKHYLTNPPLWPDLQTRLTVRELAGGRTVIHAGSPYGTGQIAPVILEHHKFLVRTQVERRAIAENYERIHVGSGLGAVYRPFSLPETCYLKLNVAELQ